MINKTAISLGHIAPLEAAIAVLLNNAVKQQAKNDLQRVVDEAYYFPGIPKASSRNDENGEVAMITKIAKALIGDHYARLELAEQQKVAMNPGMRIPLSALAGAGVGAGGAALAGEEDPKVLALAGLLGGSAGAYLGSNAIDAAMMRGGFPAGFQPGIDDSLSAAIKMLGKKLGGQ